MIDTGNSQHLFDLLKYGKCDRCKENFGSEDHPCSFAEEVNYNYGFRCNCCYKCVNKCAADHGDFPR